MRDAGIELYELTDAALHWFLRSSDKGHYGIYLEARGVNVVVDKSNSEPELQVDDGRVAGLAYRSRSAARAPTGVVKAEGRKTGSDAKMGRPNEISVYAEDRSKRKRRGEPDASPSPESRPSKQKCVSLPTQLAVLEHTRHISHTHRQTPSPRTSRGSSERATQGVRAVSRRGYRSAHRGWAPHVRRARNAIGLGQAVAWCESSTLGAGLGSVQWRATRLVDAAYSRGSGRRHSLSLCPSKDLRTRANLLSRINRRPKPSELAPLSTVTVPAENMRTEQCPPR